MNTMMILLLFLSLHFILHHVIMHFVLTLELIAHHLFSEILKKSVFRLLCPTAAAARFPGRRPTSPAANPLAAAR